MSDLPKKIIDGLNDVFREIKNDEDLKKVAHEIKSTGEKAWGKMQSSVQSIIEKVNEIPDNNWSKIAQGALDGKIVIPSSKVKKYLEQNILKRKQNLKSIEILFAKDQVRVNFELGEALPIKGSFHISIFEINICKRQQTITFKVDKPIELDSQGIPEETIVLLSSLLGLSLNDALDLEKILPEELKSLAKKDDLWQVDLSDSDLFQKWIHKKIANKSVLDFFAIQNAQITPDHITLYPHLNTDS